METPPLLASVKDLALLLRVPEQDARLALALRRASSRFIDAVGWPVVRQENDTLVLHGDGSRSLPLPARNVTAATATIDGEPATGLVLDKRLGVLTRAAGWPYGHANIVVTYTHGWPIEEMPEGIQDAVLEHASHLALTTGVATQEGTGTSSVTWAKEATVGVTQKWTEAEIGRAHV